MTELVLDCFGGDRSPGANIDGGLRAIKEISDLKLILTGDENIISEYLKDKKYPHDRVEIVHAPEIIDCNDKPTDAIRLKRESSMMKSIRRLREDEGVSGLVSTGSTGALVAATTLRIGRIKGVIRPAFCPILPTMNGSIVGICDSGANVDITPDHLCQFAIMGSLYLEKVYDVKKPRVGLLNIGVEEEKGDDLRREAYKLLTRMNDKGIINFSGNMEARELLSGKFDLVVCDGFSGNVLVKSAEGTALGLLKKIKKDISSKLMYKIGALLMYKMFMEEKEFMNYQNYGGSVMLGSAGVVVKGHGSSDADAVYVCIKQAYDMHMSDLNLDIEKKIELFEEMKNNA